MPSKETVLRQRAFGGALGVVLLGMALVYHFFPRVFHVDPTQVAPRRSMNMGPMTSSSFGAPRAVLPEAPGSPGTASEADKPGSPEPGSPEPGGEAA